MKVSIAMCTYNGAPFLREQLDSLLGQRRLPDEVVICYDASNDESVQILESFSLTAPFRVRLYLNSTNLGVLKNFENAISACTGEVIFLCDQDDVWRADKIESVASTFESDPRVGLVLSDAELVDSSLVPIGKRLFNELGFTPRMTRLAVSGQRLDIFLRRNYFCGAAMAFRAHFRQLVQPIPDGGPLIHDGWIGLMIAAVGRLAFTPHPLIKYRQHAAQQVGVAHLTILEDVIHTQRTDRKFYTSQAAQLSEALARLVDYGIDAGNEQFLRQIITHLNERAKLPESQLRRIGSVSKEIMNRRYHRFSRGWFSAAKDLFVN